MTRRKFLVFSLVTIPSRRPLDRWCKHDRGHEVTVWILHRNGVFAGSVVRGSVIGAETMNPRKWRECTSVEWAKRWVEVNAR